MRVVLLLGLLALAIAAGAQNLECLTCHSAPSFRVESAADDGATLYVDSRQIRSSVHGSLKCVDCHTDLQGASLPHKSQLAPVQCGRCHDGGMVKDPTDGKISRYADSTHGLAAKRGDPDAPRCKDCHGSHGIRPPTDPESRVNRGNIVKTCGRCHFDDTLSKRHDLGSVRRFTESVHGKGAAVCTDCHGTHGILAPDKSTSSVAKPNIPATCGKCHSSVYGDYEMSIHGKALARGVKEAPACNDCHGEHLIRPTGSTQSSVHPSHVVATCSKCHENVKLQRRFGISAGRSESYRSSYHGIANKYGDLTAANCATCHGAHKVLPSSDPQSSVNKNNLPKTCGTCHPGASENFARGSVHVLPSTKSDVVVFWVSLFYGVFVVGTIGAFLCYIGLDLKARWKGRLPWRRHPAGDPSIKSEAEFERMTLNLRIQHIVMIISFFLLVLTGLPLKYPDAWASAKIIGLLGGFTLRAVIHRIAAVMLIGLAAYHVIYSISSRNGRSELRAFVPKVKDVHDAIGTIKFYLGFSKDMPKFDRYNFIEKFEYFAVGWGSVVMIATGFALWFQTKALLVLPLWLLDVARVVHSYEALLAFLTIIIWHFYHVHFNPSVFPMSKIWLNGRITEHEMKELHPIEYERLMKRREERQERSKDQ